MWMVLSTLVEAGEATVELRGQEGVEVIQIVDRTYSYNPWLEGIDTTVVIDRLCTTPCNLDMGAPSGITLAPSPHSPWKLPEYRLEVEPGRTVVELRPVERKLFYRANAQWISGLITAGVSIPFAAMGYLSAHHEVLDAGPAWTLALGGSATFALGGTLLVSGLARRARLGQGEWVVTQSP